MTAPPATESEAVDFRDCVVSPGKETLIVKRGEGAAEKQKRGGLKISWKPGKKERKPVRDLKYEEDPEYGESIILVK